MSSSENNSQMIKKEAQRLGFLFCGISKADFLEYEAPLLETWLKNNYHGEMSYMERYYDKRLDPRKLVEGAKSVISLAYNYFPEPEIEKKYKFSHSLSFKKEDSPKIARYALGEDYHKVVKDKLHELTNFIQEEIGAIEGRVFVDSAPVLERAWAEKSGIGWIGKNTHILNKKAGSYFFLGEIISDLDLTQDQASVDHCGTCTRCIDACPTQAIKASQILDASRCISYLTIELKKDIDLEFRDKLEDWSFGCDICQEVCPWNRFSLMNQEPRFKAKNELLEMSKNDWMEITDEVFTKVFANSSLKRAGLVKMKKNIKASL